MDGRDNKPSIHRNGELTMIHLVILGPLAVAGGGLLGMAHERFRRKRLRGQLSTKSTSAAELEAMVAAKDDIGELRFSERAAHLALGVSAVGLLFHYPLLGFFSLPFLGYSAFNWLRAHYPTEERQWYKSPLAVVTMVALTGTVLTGFWTLAALILTLDLAFRRWDWVLDEDWHKNFYQRVKTWTRRALQGERRWEWFPILLSRVSLGVFFAISGWNKLFTAAHWNGLVTAMISTGLPFPKFLSAFLASVEFYGGSLLAIGFLSTFWAVVLAFAMLVAIVTVEIPHVIPPGLGPLDWFAWFLYLPQVMYVILFTWLIIRGPGPHSVDAIIARKFGLDKEDKTSGSPEKSPEDKVGYTIDMEPQPA